MADEITERHLKRLRVRGAPATIPGAAGFIGSYDVEEVWRQTGRALVLPLPRALTPEVLRDAFARLAAMATQQNATVLGFARVLTEAERRGDFSSSLGACVRSGTTDVPLLNPTGTPSGQCIRVGQIFDPATTVRNPLFTGTALLKNGVYSPEVAFISSALLPMQTV